jgi:hypothetical protein
VFSEQSRGITYRVSLGVLGLAGVYGILSNEQVVAWTALVLAITGNGLATANTKVKWRRDK